MLAELQTLGLTVIEGSTISGYANAIMVSNLGLTLSAFRIAYGINDRDMALNELTTNSFVDREILEETPYLYEQSFFKEMKEWSRVRTKNNFSISQYEKLSLDLLGNLETEKIQNVIKEKWRALIILEMQMRRVDTYLEQVQTTCLREKN